MTGACGRPDWVAPAAALPPSFAATPARHANARALVPILDAIFATRPWAEWHQRLHAHGLTFGEIATVDDARHDRQMTDSGALVPFDDPRAGAPLTVSSPLWLQGVDKVPPRMAPELGEHSTEILREQGYGDADIEALLEARVIIQGKSS